MERRFYQRNPRNTISVTKPRYPPAKPPQRRRSPPSPRLLLGAAP
jgi:hypothetical protein